MATPHELEMRSGKSPYELEIKSTIFVRKMCFAMVMMCEVSQTIMFQQNLNIKKKLAKKYISAVFQNYEKKTKKLHWHFCCFQNYQKNTKQP